MYTYLKDRQHYEDRYDKWTVDRCRNFASHKPEITDEDFAKEKLTPEQVKAMKEIKGNWFGIVQEMATFGYAAERYNNKNSYIDKQMREDREKDERLAKIQPPGHIRCRECLAITGLKLISADEWHGDSKTEQILFMFKCSHCDTNTGYFDNGKQYYVEPTLCPECRRDEHTFTKKNAKHKITFTYTCSYCSHVWDEVLDFTPKKEEYDPNYLEDRKLYCYSGKVRKWAADMIRTGPLLKNFPSAEVREERAKTKQALDTIQKLTISQVSKLLAPKLAKQGYADFQLGKPDMGKQVTVPFTVMDSKDRVQDESHHILYKLITKSIDDSNWRLVRSSLNYRLGYLSGKLKAYETDADLLILLNKKKGT